MARKIAVTLVDDFDGTEAAETVRFSLDGKNYEIDLSKSNASEFRRTLKPYTDRARTTRRARGARRGTPTRVRAQQKPEGYDQAEVRAWAKAHRIKVAERGRISSDVVEQWRSSNGK